MKKELTPKQKVLLIYPDAYCICVGNCMYYVRGKHELSEEMPTAKQAWANAWELIK